MAGSPKFRYSDIIIYQGIIMQYSVLCMLIMKEEEIEFASPKDIKKYKNLHGLNR